MSNVVGVMRKTGSCLRAEIFERIVMYAVHSTIMCLACATHPTPLLTGNRCNACLAPNSLAMTGRAKQGKITHAKKHACREVAHPCALYDHCREREGMPYSVRGDHVDHHEEYPHSYHTWSWNQEVVEHVLSLRRGFAAPDRSHRRDQEPIRHGTWPYSIERAIPLKHRAATPAREPAVGVFSRS